MQPNTGDISDEGLLARLKANAADGIYTTLIGAHAQLCCWAGWTRVALGMLSALIAHCCCGCLPPAACHFLNPTAAPTFSGVGLDFNSELVESISKVKGANYFSVHTPGEFKRRLVDQFDFAVR